MEEVWNDINLASLRDHTSREPFSVNSNHSLHHHTSREPFSLNSNHSLHREPFSLNSNHSLHREPFSVQSNHSLHHHTSREPFSVNSNHSLHHHTSREPFSLNSNHSLHREPFSLNSNHSLHREPFSVHSNHHNNSHFIFQDFLPTRPLSNEPPTNRVSSNGGNNLLYGSSVPPSATVLSLNSGPGFDFLDNINSRMQSSPISTLPTFNCPFQALASSSSLVSFGKKRVQESDNSGGDQRHKRMIKNRQSAARSRARKQAYTNELEHEVTLLMEENKKLREQQEQSRVAAAAQITRKRTLHRTLTAPF